MDVNTCQWIQKKLAAYCTDRSKDPLLISECPFWASLCWAYSFRTKLDKSTRAQCGLVSQPRVSSGFQDVKGWCCFRCFWCFSCFQGFQNIWSWDLVKWVDLSTWARCGLVSQPRVSFGFSALKVCCFKCVQGLCWHFCPRMCNVLDQDLETIADVPAVFFVLLIFVMKHNWQIRIQKYANKC